MPAPSLCTITGTLRKANGAVWPNGQLTISRAASTSQVLGGTSVIITADASGAVSFSLVQGSIVTISGAFVIGKDAGVDYDFSRGLRIFVPVQSSATLEALKTIEDELAAISAPTTDAIEVQEAGVSLGSFTALNFATGATVTDAGGGVADVDITGGGGGGSVSSVFGRTGAVVAVTNDYTFAQIDKTTSSLADLTTRSASDLSSGTLPDARFPATLPALSGANLTALNASNLASGTVPLARLSGITTTELSGSAGITSAQLAGSIAITKIAITGTPDGTKFLRDDASWQTIPGGGDALTSNPLSQFAATTSAQLAGVLSDETGFTTGALAVFSKSPTIETPTIASFTNATHDHSNAAGGGQIAISAGISGLGTGIATALGVNVGSAGAPVLFNGALGTPTSGVISTGVTLGGVTMTMGSDADGDIYYRASNVLTRLAKGTAGQVLTMNAGATAPEWAAAGGGGSLTVGTTAIASGTAMRLLYETAGNVLGEISGVTSDGTSITALPVAGVITQTSNSATAFESGPNGGTNPVFRLVNSTASAATGIQITGRAAGAGVTIASISSGTNESILIAPKGSGQVSITTSLGTSTFTNSVYALSLGGPIRDASTFFVGSGGGLTGLILGNAMSIKWSTTANWYDTSDTGLTRSAAGAVRVTNASTGAGSLVLGTSTVGSIGTSGVGVLAIANGTAPSSSPADEFQLYSADWNGAGTAAAHFRNEEGHTIKLARAATYTPTNVTTDRSYDANATTLDEVADVLGTLIADLQTLGFLG